MTFAVSNISVDFDGLHEKLPTAGLAKNNEYARYACIQADRAVEAVIRAVVTTAVLNAGRPLPLGVAGNRAIGNIGLSSRHA